MNTSTSTNQKGFTIIEVVLVLAIAGLIFLMVFLAVPALQRSNRDTQRRNDLGRFMAQITAYQSNTKGGVPAATGPSVKSFVTSYLNVGGDVFQDPNGSPYSYVTGTGAAPTIGGNGIAGIRYATSARCGGGGAISGGGSARQIAVSIALEGGGAYCQQN